MNVLSKSFTQEEKRLLQECIHCGFCLPSCPTYVSNGKEMDSPRGRLHLIEAILNGRIDLSETFFRHTDLCLLCRACETACPSGVQFGYLMERTRQATLSTRLKSKMSLLISSFLMRRIIPSHRALSVLFALTWLYQRSGCQWLTTHAPFKFLIPMRLQLVQESLPSIPGRRFGDKKTIAFSPSGKKRGKVILFTGCIMDHLFPDVHKATIRILTWNGFEVVVPNHQTCCGALHAHSGDKETVRELAERNLSALSDNGINAIIVNAAGCGAHLKNYDRILGHNGSTEWTRKIMDLTEFLTAINLRTPDRSLDMKVVYDEPCHLIHGQGISAEPKDLVQSIPGIELLRLEESDRCCGSAGSYVLAETQMSLELLERKMDFIERSGTDAVITANPGCQIHLDWGTRRHGLSIQVLHIAELLDQAYRGDPRYLAQKNRWKT